jgi:hypothetical protein
MTSANDPSATPAPESGIGGSSKDAGLPASAHPTGIQATPSGPSAAVQTAPPEPAASIPVPPPAAPRKRLTPERLAQELGRLDAALVVIVLVLGFLIASFAARNSDLWMHLAAGRDLLGRKYDLRHDPYAFTTGGGPWVNHSWLSDVIFYGVYSLADGAGLVVFKALLVTLLAWVMLQVRRPGQSVWVPAACTAVALVAMSHRLLLQSTVISFLFLALTVYLLARERRPEVIPSSRHPVTPSSRHFWLLPPLFALWANLDAWFFLGPLTLALYLLGEVVQQALAPVRTGPDAPDPRERRTLALVLVAGLFACLLNPHHFRVFALPPELLPGRLPAAFREDSVFRPMFYSPFEPDYFSRPGLWRNAGSFAYYLLLVLGLVSFALNAGGWRWWRALVWATFALLSAWHARAVPFFAVVAAPVAALNFQDYAARRFGVGLPEGEGWRRWAVMGRALTVLAGLALLAAAWPGWLHAYPTNPYAARRVAWQVDVDPALERAARQLGDWRRQGRLPPGNGFNYSPDAASYFAWFCPDEQSYFDYRFELHAGEAAEYVRLREVLRGGPPPDRTGRRDAAAPPGQPTFDWRSAFRDRKINHVVVSGAELADVGPVLRRLLTRPQEWVPMYLDGKALVFGWKDPRDADAAQALEALRLDLNRPAFGPDAARLPNVASPERTKSTVWSRYLTGPGPRPPQEEEARMYLQYYHEVTDREGRVAQVAWSWASKARTVAASGGTPDPLSAVVATILARATDTEVSARVYAGMAELGPPAAPVLAVRAARRAVAANPRDPDCHLTLANAYAVLWTAQEDRWAGSRVGQTLTPRQLLREVQLVTALQQVIALKPDAAPAHFTLGQVFRQMNYFDLSTKHFREYITHTRADPPPGTDPEKLDDMLADLEDEVARQEKQVRNARTEYELQAARQPPLAKAVLALQLGLADQALTALLDADSSQFGREGAHLQLMLLLTMGRADDVRRMLEPELKTALGYNYDWFGALLAAATGKYADAGASLDEAIDSMERRAVANMVHLVRVQTLSSVSPDLFRAWPSEVAGGGITGDAKQIAEYHVIRGLVAVEAGDNATAEQNFLRARDIGLPKGRGPALIAQFSAPSPVGAAALVGSAGRLTTADFEGRSVAVQYLRLLQDAKK